LNSETIILCSESVWFIHSQIHLKYRGIKIIQDFCSTLLNEIT